MADLRLLCLRHAESGLFLQVLSRGTSFTRFPSLSPPSVSFEDKLKENFARGSAELEKRRQALEDAQRKEKERREREEREAQERREREARELENRRKLEEERRLERMREMERQREEERVRELERKEVSGWIWGFWGGRGLK